ncbi:MAG TPA: Gfo/Idh/MocA family oxidoreductase [Bryobacteraceae bacterium]|nr:Gfo/Idh/MocA family oxidoreductase [Bryobacteraceae bacterium]
MDFKNAIPRREVLSTAAAALTTSLFTGNVKGANDRVAVAFIGLGAMGSGNLGYAMQVPEVQPVAVCDVYQPHLDRALDAAKKRGFEPKPVKDFRELLADKSIDAVCISTPDHWHAYMTVEACKAGKDVWVEKPASTYVEEGRKMVQAARKYDRVVQAGSMQRSGGYFRKAAELVAAGTAGEVTFCHTFQSGSTARKGFGNPPDSDAPPDLDWEMWLGPAPKVPFNLNRWGVKTATFPTFRYFWDYAGGAMTDWGVHLIDPLHQCFGEVMPTAVAALGDKFYVRDNTETPDTMHATFYYPKFLVTYESRTCNPLPLFGRNQGAGTTIHGTEATIFVNRSGCWLIPNAKSKVAEASWENDNEMRQMNVPHWKNWIECIKTRQKPTSEIETCVRSSTVCQLANLSMRFKHRLDWDEQNWTVQQDAVKPYLNARYRAPWKLEV